MTNGWAGEAASRPNAATCASPAAVVPSTTSAAVSVFCCTRPSPGKCLSVAVTPCAARPSITAPAAPTTASAVLPYCRSRAPIGGLAASVPAGTTSATGARSRFTPASWRGAPVRSASADRSAGGRVPWTRAEGIASNPGPLSVWTRPPSWSTAIQSPGPGAAACHVPTVAARSAAGACDRPARKMPPTPLAATAPPPPRASRRTPTTNSWATRPRGSRAASAAVTAFSGPVGVGAAVLLGAVLGGVLLGTVLAEAELLPASVPSRPPPEEQAPTASSRQPSTAIRRPALRMVLLDGSDLLRPDGPSPASLPDRRSAPVEAQRVIRRHLHQHDAHPVRVLDPRLDETPRLLAGGPQDRHARRRQPGLLGGDVAHLEPEGEPARGLLGLAGDLEQAAAQEVDGAGVLRRAELPVHGQAEHAAVEGPR